MPTVVSLHKELRNVRRVQEHTSIHGVQGYTWSTGNVHKVWEKYTESGIIHVHVIHGVQAFYAL